MGGDVINLASKLKDGTKQSPEMCLRDCLDKDVGKRGAFKNGKKLFIVALDETDGEYSVSWCQAGMRMSEILALLEISKVVVKDQMGY